MMISNDSRRVLGMLIGMILMISGTFIYTEYMKFTSAGYVKLVGFSDILPEFCNNEEDDDGDGKVDCKDSDCFTHKTCKKPKPKYIPCASCPTILPHPCKLGMCKYHFNEQQCEFICLYP